MAEAVEPGPVKLICGMISARVELFDRALERMAAMFGPTDVLSDVMDFDFTHYYDRQMGWPLYRRLAAFERLIPPDELIEVKCRTNGLESLFAIESAGSPPRPINLDPGYVTEAKLVLASMKDFSHRIYLGRGVYGEITLVYRKGRWEPFGNQTFPDYASRRYDSFLTAVRDRLRAQRAQEKRQ